MKTIVNAIILQNRKILLIRKKQIWILPGGKIKERESDIECLCREVDEELSETRLKNFRFYNVFEGITPHSKELARAVVYFADVDEQLNSPSAEIEEARFISYEDKTRYSSSDITSKVIEKLREDSYV